MTTGSWGGHEFFVSSTGLMAYKDLTIKASCETEEKTSSKTKYVARKNTKPVEITFSVILNQLLGADVRASVDAFAADAYNGTQDYITINGAHLFECRFMMTEASAEEIVQSASGQWISANLKLTFKQSSKFDVQEEEKKSGGGGGGGSKKSSVKTKAAKTTTVTEHYSVITSGTGTGVQTGVAKATATTAAAKVASAVTTVVSTAAKLLTVKK